MPKKHHSVAVTYLRRFTDGDGLLWVYRKDDPSRPFRQRAESMGFETHYHSKVGDDGVRDDSRLEALFSEMESPWLAIVEALADRQRRVDHLVARGAGPLSDPEPGCDSAVDVDPAAMWSRFYPIRSPSSKLKRWWADDRI